MLTLLRQGVCKPKVEHLLDAWNIKVREVTTRVPAPKPKGTLVWIRWMMPLPLLCYQPANISAHRVQQRTEAAKANEAESHYFIIDPKERERLRGVWEKHADGGVRAPIRGPRFRLFCVPCGGYLYEGMPGKVLKHKSKRSPLGLSTAGSTGCSH